MQRLVRCSYTPAIVIPLAELARATWVPRLVVTPVLFRCVTQHDDFLGRRLPRGRSWERSRYTAFTSPSGVFPARTLGQSGSVARASPSLQGTGPRRGLHNVPRIKAKSTETQGKLNQKRHACTCQGKSTQKSMQALHARSATHLGCTWGEASRRREYQNRVPGYQSDGTSS